MYCITQSQGDSMGETRFRFGKSIFKLRTSNYDENIHSYQSSHLQSLKECMKFGKLECFSKFRHSMNT